MKFFNIDFHVSVIHDIKSILSELGGHSVDDKSLSDHSFVVGRNKDYIPSISDGQWMNYFRNWNPQKFIELFGFLNSYDGFISTYPPIFSTLYLGFQKPSIMYMPIRFDYGVHNNVESLKKFVETIKKSENLFVLANNKFDCNYFKFLTGLECDTIPSLCDYTKLQYNGGDLNKTLIYNVNGMDMNRINFSYELKSNLPHRYKWEELLKYKAIVHFPYDVSTMSIFEHYTASIPLFFPTKKFLSELYFNKQGVLYQVSHYQVWNSHPKTLNEFYGDIDLNNYTSHDTVKEWLEYADFYDEEWMPFIQLFDSFDELNEKIHEADFNTISGNMKKFNRGRKEKILSKWRKTLSQLPRA